MKAFKALSAILVVGAVWLPSLGWAQTTTAGLPVRNMTVSGAQVSTQAYVDMGTFQPRIFPLDDRGAYAP